MSFFSGVSLGSILSSVNAALASSGTVTTSTTSTALTAAISNMFSNSKSSNISLVQQIAAWSGNQQFVQSDCMKLLQSNSLTMAQGNLVQAIMAAKDQGEIITLCVELENLINAGT